MRKILTLLAVLACAASCIYPYEAELEDSGLGGNLVVEGDIIVGSTSYFTLSYLSPMDATGINYVYDGNVWIENDAGAVYTGVRNGKPGEWKVDLAGAPADAQYRVCISITGGRDYVSGWSAAAGDCIIDDIHCEVRNAPGTVAGVTIYTSLHSELNNKHFRYRYVEDWEYTALERAWGYYNPDVPESLADEFPFGIIEFFEGDDNTYYCWKKAESRGINLATTEIMGVNKLEDWPLFFYPCTDDRLSALYRLRLEVYAIPEECYRYLEHVRDMSEYDGNLFAPMPSEVRGNLRCTTDDDEIVYGYVGVAYPASAEFYMSSDDIGRIYQRPIHEYEPPETPAEEQWYNYYYIKAWRPYSHDPFSGWEWMPGRCVDCRFAGGTKNRPDNWPTDHK